MLRFLIALAICIAQIHCQGDDGQDVDETRGISDVQLILPVKQYSYGLKGQKYNKGKGVPYPIWRSREDFPKDPNESQNITSNEENSKEHTKDTKEIQENTKQTESSSEAAVFITPSSIIQTKVEIHHNDSSDKTYTSQPYILKFHEKDYSSSEFTTSKTYNIGDSHENKTDPYASTESTIEEKVITEIVTEYSVSNSSSVTVVIPSSIEAKDKQIGNLQPSDKKETDQTPLKHLKPEVLIHTTASYHPNIHTPDYRNDGNQQWTHKFYEPTEVTFRGAQNERNSQSTVTNTNSEKDISTPSSRPTTDSATNVDIHSSNKSDKELPHTTETTLATTTSIKDLSSIETLHSFKGNNEKEISKGYEVHEPSEYETEQPETTTQPIISSSQTYPSAEENHQSQKEASLPHPMSDQNPSKDLSGSNEDISIQSDSSEVAHSDASSSTHLPRDKNEEFNANHFLSSTDRGIKSTIKEEVHEEEVQSTSIYKPCERTTKPTISLTEPSVNPTEDNMKAEHETYNLKLENLTSVHSHSPQQADTEQSSNNSNTTELKKPGLHLEKDILSSLLEEQKPGSHISSLQPSFSYSVKEANENPENGLKKETIEPQTEKQQKNEPFFPLDSSVKDSSEQRESGSKESKEDTVPAATSVEEQRKEVHQLPPESFQNNSTTDKQPLPTSSNSEEAITQGIVSTTLLLNSGEEHQKVTEPSSIHLANSESDSEHVKDEHKSNEDSSLTLASLERKQENTKDYVVAITENEEDIGQHTQPIEGQHIIKPSVQKDLSEGPLNEELINVRDQVTKLLQNTQDILEGQEKINEQKYLPIGPLELPDDSETNKTRVETASSVNEQQKILDSIIPSEMLLQPALQEITKINKKVSDLIESSIENIEHIHSSIQGQQTLIDPIHSWKQLEQDHRTTAPSTTDQSEKESEKETTFQITDHMKQGQENVTDYAITDDDTNVHKNDTENRTSTQGPIINVVTEISVEWSNNRTSGDQKSDSKAESKEDTGILHQAEKVYQELIVKPFNFVKNIFG